MFTTTSRLGFPVEHALVAGTMPDMYTCVLHGWRVFVWRMGMMDGATWQLEAHPYRKDAILMQQAMRFDNIGEVRDKGWPALGTNYHELDELTMMALILELTKTPCRDGIAQYTPDLAVCDSNFAR